MHKPPLHHTADGFRYEFNPDLHRRDKWHDYRGKGIYHIVLKVRQHLPLFGHLEGNIKAEKGSGEYPHIVLTDLGKFAEQALYGLPNYYASKGVEFSIIQLQMMPDHIHVIINIKRDSETHLGSIIRNYKAYVTGHFKKMEIVVNIDNENRKSHSSNDPNIITGNEGYSPTSSYTYASPLWENEKSGYHECIMRTERQLSAWQNYLTENPYRRMVMKLHPNLFERRLHITIANKDFAAYGNMFLLKNPSKLQIFFHRHVQPSQCNENGALYPPKFPYEQTCQFFHERDEILEQADNGTVLVSPFISKGEKVIEEIALEKDYSLILIQKEPIKVGWKPEGKKWHACSNGKLLILAPWELDSMEDYNGVPSETNYSRFHNMNNLASEITSLDNETSLMLKKS